MCTTNHGIITGGINLQAVLRSDADCSRVGNKSSENSLGCIPANSYSEKIEEFYKGNDDQLHID